MVTGRTDSIQCSRLAKADSTGYLKVQEKSARDRMKVYVKHARESLKHDHPRRNVSKIPIR